MSQLVNAVLLFVVGTALSFITNNSIVTTVGCFLVGIVLNRSGRGSARPVSLKTVGELPRSVDYPDGVSMSRRCNDCGAASDRYTKYCINCGSEMGTPSIQAEKGKKTAMFCAQCGANLKIDSEFCERCGTRIGV